MGGKRGKLLGQVEFGVVDRIAEREDCSRVAFDRDIREKNSASPSSAPCNMARNAEEGSGNARVMRRQWLRGWAVIVAVCGCRSRAQGRSTGSIGSRRDAWSIEAPQHRRMRGHKAPRQAGQHRIQGQQRGGDRTRNQ